MSLANVRNAVFDQNADRVYVITPDVRILDVIEMIGDFWQLVNTIIDRKKIPIIFSILFIRIGV